MNAVDAQAISYARTRIRYRLLQRVACDFDPRDEDDLSCWLREREWSLGFSLSDTIGYRVQRLYWSAQDNCRRARRQYRHVPIDVVLQPDASKTERDMAPWKQRVKQPRLTDARIDETAEEVVACGLLSASCAVASGGKSTRLACLARLLYTLARQLGPLHLDGFWSQIETSPLWCSMGLSIRERQTFMQRMRRVSYSGNTYRDLRAVGIRSPSTAPWKQFNDMVQSTYLKRNEQERNRAA